VAVVTGLVLDHTEVLWPWDWRRVGRADWRATVVGHHDPGMGGIDLVVSAYRWRLRRSRYRWESILPSLTLHPDYVRLDLGLRRRPLLPQRIRVLAARL
jgi:hypothetical protein